MARYTCTKNYSRSDIYGGFFLFRRLSMSKALMEAAKLYNDPRFLSKSEIRIYENKKRRQRIVRRQKMTLAFVIALIVLKITI